MRSAALKVGITSIFKLRHTSAQGHPLSGRIKNRAQVCLFDSKSTQEPLLVSFRGNEVNVPNLSTYLANYKYGLSPIFPKEIKQPCEIKAVW